MNVLQGALSGVASNAAKVAQQGLQQSVTVATGVLREVQSNLPGVNLASAPQVLLDNLEVWSQLNTKDVTLEQVLKPNSDDVEGLEVIRSLDSLRRTAVFEEGLDNAQLDKILAYIAQIESLISKLEPVGIPIALNTQWTSPLANKPTSFYTLQGLACEMAMATYMYGGALRGAAYYMVSDHDLADCCQEATTLLRRAAGVYQWLQERGLPRALDRLPSDRPVEATMPMAKIQGQIALAEAQMVTAARAEQRGVSVTLVAALHAAAWELWETAARTLRTHTPEWSALNDSLRRYIASSSAICKSRALRAMATDLRTNKSEAGQAEACCVLAASLLQSAMAAADINLAWRQQVKLEAALVETNRLQCQNDRQHIYFQQIPKNPPDLPAGKVLVSPLPFQPVLPDATGTVEVSATPGALLSSPASSKDTAGLTAAVGRSLSIRDQ